MITDATKIPDKILARMVIPEVEALPKEGRRALTEEQINKLKTKEEIALALLASEIENNQDHIFKQLEIHVNANRLAEARSIERSDKAEKYIWAIVLIIIGAVATAYAAKIIH